MRDTSASVRRQRCQAKSHSRSRGRMWAAVGVHGTRGGAGRVGRSNAEKKQSLQCSTPIASSNTLVATNADLPTNEVAQAIMVTVDLDFGGKPPSIKDALKEIERSYEPKGERTFAILDAYGEPTPHGQASHLHAPQHGATWHRLAHFPSHWRGALEIENRGGTHRAAVAEETHDHHGRQCRQLFHARRFKGRRARVGCSD